MLFGVVAITESIRRDDNKSPSATNFFYFSSFSFLFLRLLESQTDNSPKQKLLHTKQKRFKVDDDQEPTASAFDALATRE